MKFGSLFSGIGAMDLGLERAGFECAWQVEIDEYKREVLRRHWPLVPKYQDVREVGGHNLERVDIVAGGFPCPDISCAGFGSGLDGERSGLWRDMFRVVRDLRPRFALVENVAALTFRGLGSILADFASIGFDVEWETVRASAFGAPHRRERVYLVAYPNQSDGEEGMGIKSHRARKIFSGGNQECFSIWLQAADRFVGVDDGLAARIYQHRAGACGDAVVPQIVEWIGKQILSAYK